MADAMATPTWMTTVESAARTLNASLASYESTDVTSTITALKPHEMADPTARLLPSCRSHPMCCRVLTGAGKQHGKPLRDMSVAELDAAIEHRRLGGHASCPADVDGLTAAEKIKVLAPIVQREVLKGDQFKQLHEQRLRYATQSVLGQRPRALQNVGEERDDVFEEPADAHGGVRVQLVGAPGDPALLALAGGAARHRGLRGESP